jgi:hypothetical protein
MPTTYEPIATQTLTSSAASITFSSITSAFTDLKVIVTAKGLGVTNTYVQLQFNGDTGSNYSFTYLRGEGTAATSGRSNPDNGILACGIATAGVLSTTIPAFAEIDIFSYTGSTNKSVLCKGSIDKNGSGESNLIVGLWRNTAAITSVIIKGLNANFATDTSATLYGIKNA